MNELESSYKLHLQGIRRAAMVLAPILILKDWIHRNWAELSYICTSFFIYKQLIKKGGGTDPMKPWQPYEGN